MCGLGLRLSDAIEPLAVQHVRNGGEHPGHLAVSGPAHRGGGHVLGSHAVAGSGCSCGFFSASKTSRERRWFVACTRRPAASRHQTTALHAECGDRREGALSSQMSVVPNGYFVELRAGQTAPGPLSPLPGG